MYVWRVRNHVNTKLVIEFDLMFWNVHTTQALVWKEGQRSTYFARQNTEEGLSQLLVLEGISRCLTQESITVHLGVYQLNVCSDRTDFSQNGLQVASELADLRSSKILKFSRGAFPQTPLVLWPLQPSSTV